MNKTLNLSKIKKTLLTLILTAALITILLLPAQESTATPTTDQTVGVDGRVLSADDAGDISDWIEIAQYGDYSLIVRKSYINIRQSGHYGDPIWQYTDFGKTNAYGSSTVRNKINDWFNGRATGTADNLHKNARLRDYTMQNNAINVLGTGTSKEALINGFSKPTVYQVGVGNDIAFALSYSEAANFLSKTHDIRGMNPQVQPSNTIAKTNYGKMELPQIWAYGAWLRSPGDISYTAAALDYTGRVFQYMIDPVGNNERGLVYPAVWVKSTIFETTPPTYSIEYILNGGVNNANNPTTYTTNNLPLTIANPTKNGYNFSHWTTTTALQNNNIIPQGTTGNITLTANWSTPIQYNITYNLNGGTPPTTANPTTYNIENTHTINNNTLNLPTMTGYRFVNWIVQFTDSTTTELTPNGLPQGTTGNILLIALWDPTPISFNITYNLSDGGINAAGNTGTYSVTDNFPVTINNPTRPGYTFIGWVVVYSNGTVTQFTPTYNIPTGTAGDILLTALWNPLPQQTYNITYNLGDSATITNNPTTYTTNNLPLTIPNPSRTNYAFSHWILKYSSGVEVAIYDNAIPAGATGDVTLTAVWTALPSYNIYYVLNGGVNAANNPTTYTTSTSLPIAITPPTMNNYTFLYWIAVYANGSIEILPTSNIPTGTTGDITLIAAWYP